MKKDTFNIHYEKLKEDEGYIDFFKEYARVNSHINQDETRKVFEKVMEISKDKNYKLAYAWSKLWLGNYYQDITRWKTAIAFHTEVLDIFLNENEEIGQAHTYSALMDEHIKVGLLDLAIEYGLKGLAIAEKLDEKNLILSFLINIATAYCYGGHYAEVDIMLDRILNFNSVIPDDVLLIVRSIEVNRNIYYGKYQEAYDMSVESLKYSKIINYRYVDTAFKRYMAMASFKMGEFERAKSEFLLAEKECINQRDMSTLTELYIDWSDLHSILGEYEQSQSLLFKAVKKAKKNCANKLLCIIYSKIGEVYFKKGEFKAAYEASQKSVEYSKKVFKNNSLNSFIKLKSKTIVDEARVYKELYDQVTIILKIGKNITANLNKEKTFQSTYKALNVLMKADAFGIALYKPEIDTLSYEYFVQNGQIKNLEGADLKCIENLGVECFKKRKEIVINNFGCGDETKLSNVQLKKTDCKIPKSIMFYPLVSGDNILGIVSVQSYESNAYTNNDLNKMSLLSSFIAVAIENAELFKEVEYLAHYDSLTGILNRRELLKAGEAAVKVCNSKKEASTVIMVDIDHFKVVNDTYGHQAGDFVLKSVSKFLKSKISKEHLLGRYGGEEFLLILPNYTAREAKKLSEDIRKTIEGYKFQVDENNELRLTVSMGFYEINSINNTSFYDSIRYADEAMYNAKNLGRNMVVEYK